MPAAPAPGIGGSDMSDSVMGVDRVYLKWTSGSSGAVPSTLTVSTDVVSVTHGATGVYTVVLGKSFYQSLGLEQDIQQASYSKTGACKVIKTATTPSAATIVLLVVDGDGDAVDPTTSDVIELCFKLARYRSP